MPIRRIIGIVLVGAAYWIIRGRFAAMSFEVKVGNTWPGVLSDVTYLIPTLGAFIAFVGGIWAIGGASGRITASIGTLIVCAFIGLVFAMSGMMEMIQPFLAPAIVMVLATAGLFVVKTK